MNKEKLIEKVINAIDEALQQTDVSGLSPCEHKGTEWHGHVSQYRCVDCGKWLGNDASGFWLGEVAEPKLNRITKL